MQSAFCGTRNPLSYNHCKSSECHSPSEVGSGSNNTHPTPSRPPLTHTPPVGREAFFKSSNEKKQMFRRFLSFFFSQLVPHAAPTCFLSFPNSGGPPSLPSPSAGGRARGKKRETDEREAGRRRLLRGDKRSRCGGRTRQEWLHLSRLPGVPGPHFIRCAQAVLCCQGRHCACAFV